jgi:hypothetical protein
LSDEYYEALRRLGAGLTRLALEQSEPLRHFLRLAQNALAASP